MSKSKVIKSPHIVKPSAVFPDSLHFPSDGTTANLVEVTNNNGTYQYQNGYYFKDKRIVFTIGDVERMAKKRIAQIVNKE